VNCRIQGLLRKLITVSLAASLAVQTAGASCGFRVMSHESKEYPGILYHQLVTRNFRLETVFEEQALLLPVVAGVGYLGGRGKAIVDHGMTQLKEDFRRLPQFSLLNFFTFGGFFGVSLPAGDDETTAGASYGKPEDTILVYHAAMAGLASLILQYGFFAERYHPTLCFTPVPYFENSHDLLLLAFRVPSDFVDVVVDDIGALTDRTSIQELPDDLLDIIFNAYDQRQTSDVLFYAAFRLLDARRKGLLGWLSPASLDVAETLAVNQGRAEVGKLDGLIIEQFKKDLQTFSTTSQPGTSATERDRSPASIVYRVLRLIPGLSDRTVKFGGIAGLAAEILSLLWAVPHLGNWAVPALAAFAGLHVLLQYVETRAPPRTEQILGISVVLGLYALLAVPGLHSLSVILPIVIVHIVYDAWQTFLIPNRAAAPSSGITCQQLFTPESVDIPPMEVLGEKPFKLLDMARAGFKIPEFFVIKTNGSGRIQLSDSLRMLFESLKKPVICRSAHPEEGGKHSYSGVFESYGNIHALAEVELKKKAPSQGEEDDDLWFQEPESLEGAYSTILKGASPEGNYKVQQYLGKYHITDFDPLRMNMVVMEQLDMDVFGMFLTSNQNDPNKVIIQYQIRGQNAEIEEFPLSALGYRVEPAKPGGTVIYNKTTRQLEPNKLDENTQRILCQFGETARKIEEKYGVQQVELASSHDEVYVLQSRTINLGNPLDVPRFARYRTLSDKLHADGYGNYHLPVLVIDQTPNLYYRSLPTETIESVRQKYRNQLLDFQRQHPEYILVIKDAEDIVQRDYAASKRSRYSFLNQLASRAKVVVRGRQQNAIRHDDWDNVESGGISITPHEDERMMDYFCNLDKGQCALRWKYLDDMKGITHGNVTVQYELSIMTGDYLHVLSNTDGVFVWYDKADYIEPPESPQETPGTPGNHPASFIYRVLSLVFGPDHRVTKFGGIAGLAAEIPALLLTVPHLGNWAVPALAALAGLHVLLQYVETRAPPLQFRKVLPLTAILLAYALLGIPSLHTLSIALPIVIAHIVFDAWQIFLIPNRAVATEMERLTVQEGATIPESPEPSTTQDDPSVTPGAGAYDPANAPLAPAWLPGFAAMLQNNLNHPKLYPSLRAALPAGDTGLFGRDEPKPERARRWFLFDEANHSLKVMYRTDSREWYQWSLNIEFRQGEQTTVTVGSPEPWPEVERVALERVMVAWGSVIHATRVFHSKPYILDSCQNFLRSQNAKHQGNEIPEEIPDEIRRLARILVGPAVNILVILGSRCISITKPMEWGGRLESVAPELRKGLEMLSRLAGQPNKHVQVAIKCILNQIGFYETLAILGFGKPARQLSRLGDAITPLEEAKSSLPWDIARWDVDPEILDEQFRGTPEMLGLLLENCINNAGPQVEFKGVIENNEIALSVHDKGPGGAAPSAWQEPLLGASTRDGGHGIGLPTIHYLAKSLGATIEVISPPGEGTTVTIRLPVVPSDRVAPITIPGSPEPATTHSTFGHEGIIHRAA